MTKRAVVASKADKSMYRYMATSDGGDVGFVVFMATVFSALPAAICAFLVSIWFVALGLPFLLVAGAASAWALNSTPMPRYSSDRTLYQRAYDTFTALTQPDDREMGKVLLDNIWSHEDALLKLDKSHARYDCETCQTRVELMGRIKSTQALPQTHDDDIEAIKLRLQARKELSA